MSSSVVPYEAISFTESPTKTWMSYQSHSKRMCAARCAVCNLGSSGAESPHKNIHLGGREVAFSHK